MYQSQTIPLYLIARRHVRSSLSRRVLSYTPYEESFRRNRPWFPYFLADSISCSRHPSITESAQLLSAINGGEIRTRDPKTVSALTKESGAFQNSRTSRLQCKQFKVVYQLVKFKHMKWFPISPVSLHFIYSCFTALPFSLVQGKSG
jgi:hypothetical protein